jgi:hypothetical protein
MQPGSNRDGDVELRHLQFGHLGRVTSATRHNPLILVGEKKRNTVEDENEHEHEDD